MAYKKIELDSGRKNAKNSDEVIVNKNKRTTIRNLVGINTPYNMGYIKSPTRNRREHSTYEWLKEVFGAKKALDTLQRGPDSRNVTEKDRKRKNTL